VAPSPYGARDGFLSHFGADPAWWLTLVGVLCGLVVLELAFRVIKRNLVVAGLWRYRWKWMGSVSRLVSWPVGWVWRDRRRRKRGVTSTTAAASDGLMGPVSGGEDDPLEEWDLELWQEMEREPVVQMRIQQILEAEVGVCGGDEEDEETRDVLDPVGPSDEGALSCGDTGTEDLEAAFSRRC